MCAVLTHWLQQQHFAITAIEPVSTEDEDDENCSEGTDPLKVTLPGSMSPTHTHTHTVVLHVRMHNNA